MASAVQSQIDATMAQALPLEPFCDARCSQQFDACVLEHSGTHTFLAVLATPRFQHDRFNAVQMEQVGKHQTCRPGTDDSDLCLRFRHDLRLYSSASVLLRASLATWKAEFAAGTPQ